MANATKPTPVKSCDWCGKEFSRGRVGKNNQLECVSVFLRRKFCSLSCSVSRQHTRPALTAAASRKRAKRMIAGSCAACESTKELVVHHVNGDPMDNREGNLQTLCANCHSFWHGMLRRTGRLPSAPMPRLLAAGC